MLLSRLNHVQVNARYQQRDGRTLDQRRTKTIQQPLFVHAQWQNIDVLADSTPHTPSCFLALS